MTGSLMTFSLPRWRVTGWLADSGPDVPTDIRRALIASLFGTLPIFAGGVFNSLLVASIVAYRLPYAPFFAWVAIEAIVCGVRLVVLLISLRNAREGRETPTDLYLALGLCWAATVGYGAFISLLSGDWVSATLATMSAAAMVGGICFRNFGAPRLSATMTVLSLGPTCLAAPFSGEPVMYATFVQIPFYLISMRMAAYKLNALLVATMRAERESGRQARHDALTGLSNRIGLMQALDDGEKDGGGERTALLYLDLDGFKTVNDAHGHAAGDKLLAAAADRLRGLLRGGDVAARIGGDEFVIVARQVDRAQAPAFGDRLIRELSRPYVLGPGLHVTVGASVGVAIAADHGRDMAHMLDIADAALLSAKMKGKSRCVVAAPGDTAAELRGGGADGE